MYQGLASPAKAIPHISLVLGECTKLQYKNMQMGYAAYLLFLSVNYVSKKNKLQLCCSCRNVQTIGSIIWKLKQNARNCQHTFV